MGRIGQRLAGAVRLGGRLIKNIGNIGSRAVGYAEQGMASVSNIPLIGGAIAGSAPYQGLRGVVASAKMPFMVAQRAGGILEKGAELAQFAMRTNKGATGNISVGADAIIR